MQTITPYPDIQTGRDDWIRTSVIVLPKHVPQPLGYVPMVTILRIELS